MKLKIIRIENSGNLEKERLILRALEDTDIGSYMIFKTKKTPNDTISAKVSDTFWLQDKSVKKDDWVVIYTKVGAYRNITNDKGITSHFFYWDKDASLWQDLESVATLVYAPEWETDFRKA